MPYKYTFKWVTSLQSLHYSLTVLSSPTTQNQDSSQALAKVKYPKYYEHLIYVLVATLLIISRRETRGKKHNNGARTVLRSFSVFISTTLDVCITLTLASFPMMHEKQHRKRGLFHTDIQNILQDIFNLRDFCFSHLTQWLSTLSSLLSVLFY